VDRRTGLLAALVLIAGTAGGTFLLLRLAGDGSSSEAAPATTTTADEGPPIVLRGDGLGALPFGAPVDEVIAGLTLRWAPPTSDTGWIQAASSPYGVCPGTEMRAVGWRGFSVLFSDGPTPHGPAGQRHFFSWEYEVDDPTRYVGGHPRTPGPAPDEGGSRPPLHTESAISVGATVAQLRQAYGSRLELSDESGDAGGPSFGVDLPDGSLSGSVTNLGPTGVVLTIVSGGGCGE
jgi:hypothetical protein